jgi:hypothetical protein
MADDAPFVAPAVVVPLSSLPAGIVTETPVPSRSPATTFPDDVSSVSAGSVATKDGLVRVRRLASAVACGFTITAAVACASAVYLQPLRPATPVVLPRRCRSAFVPAAVWTSMRCFDQSVSRAVPRRCDGSMSRMACYGNRPAARRRSSLCRRPPCCPLALARLHVCLSLRGSTCGAPASCRRVCAAAAVAVQFAMLFSRCIASRRVRHSCRCSRRLLLAGKGKFSTVYRARVRKTDEMVALKKIQVGLCCRRRLNAKEAFVWFRLACHSRH